MNDLSDMVAQAKVGMRNAYAPYSEFSVGCCLRSASGELFVGCNVENAAYPLGDCAEAIAIGAMVCSGQHVIEAVVVMVEGELCPPCGGCRQLLSEFSTAQTPVHLCNAAGEIKTTTMGDLLPESFGAKHMEKS